MTRSRTTVLILLGVLAIAFASRSDVAVRWAQEVLGPRAALFLPAQSAERDIRDIDARVPMAEQPAAAVRQPAPPGGAAALAVATVSVEPSARVEQGYLLAARLLTKDAKPMNEVAVRFYDVTDLLGSREMLIGVATTDGQGRAVLPYLPAEGGRHEIITRSSAREQFPASEARAVFQAELAAPPAYSPEQLPLAAFSAVVPYVAGGVVLAVWALFAIALVGTARGIAAGARPAAPAIQAARGVAGTRPAARSKAREDLA